ncbi:MAG: TerD family protein [Kineosporiaceae bacterium]|nr:TerD family protein [Kineosporiaceae bacterium]MBK7624434.1 TerD family protein [Kineosporiaceae bacterium]MBK8077798.1 TerD family protein [Kineosporiaceae bacterium]
MSISLTKGGSISLAKEVPGLARVAAGLGWESRSTSTADLDASVIVCDANGRCLSEQWFVFYGNLRSPNLAVEHMGDELVGGDGAQDDEEIRVDLGLLPAEAQRLVFVVSIYDADVRRQNFGQVQRAYIRMVDAASNREIFRYDLAEDYSTETSMVFGELYRLNGDWKFRAVGQGYQGGLAAVIKDYGLNAN